MIDEGDWPDRELFGILSALACWKPPLAWAISQIRQAPKDRVPVWARLISSSLGDASEREPCLDEFLDCYSEFEPLRRILPDLREGLNIHETLVKISREDNQRRQEREAEIAGKSESRPTRRELLNSGFNSYREKGSIAWLNHSQTLLLDESAYRFAGLEFSIPASEAWAELSELERGECLEMARTYLIGHDDPRRKRDDWQRTLGSTAAYLAIDLLFEKISTDSELANAISEKWVRAYFREGWNDDDRKKAISKIIYGLNPDSTRSVFLERLSLENESNAYCQSADTLETCWDQQLGKNLAEFLRAERDLKPQTCRTAFSVLADRSPELAKELAASWLKELPDSLEGEDFQTQRAKLFCAALLTRGKLWHRAASYLHPQSLAKQVLSENSCRYSASRSLSLEHFEGGVLRQLYLLFSKLFTQPVEHRGSGAFDWGDRENTDEFLRALEFAVAKRSTPLELESVRAALPEERRNILAFTLADAQKKNASEGWSAWKPLEVLRMVQVHDAVLIQNQDDLIEFFLQRLSAFPENWTENILPLWRDLEQRGVKKPRSQSEERISLALARWLEDSAKTLIVNREAQKIETINRRPDLRVQVVIDQRELELIIEIKKASDPRTPTNLQIQLVDDYLIKGKCSHGIYLVVFFGDKKSALGGATPKEDERLLKKLTKQLTGASELRVEPMVLDFTDRR